MSDYKISISQPSGRSFSGYLIREDDGFYFDYQNSEFVGVTLSGLTFAEKLAYRFPVLEGAPGTYSTTIDLHLFQDGYYKFCIIENANGVEYSIVYEDVFEVITGEVSSKEIKVKISTAPTRSLFAYLKSTSTNLTFNPLTDTLEVLDLTTASINSRAPFRISFVEESPSNYVLSLDSSSLPDGVYSLSTFELVGDVELEAGEPVLLRIQDGRQLSGLALGSINLTDSSGGKDNLRYLQANGSPVEGALITVYLSSEFVQGNLNTIGRTTTRADGRWETPILVESGATYTVVFQKEGHFGPDQAEVVV